MSISEENDKLSQQLNPQEVGSLARSSHRTKGATGNCWQDLFQRFHMMTSQEQHHTVCEEAGFVRTVSKEMCYKTGEEVDDVHANFIASCREYTFSRSHPDSEAKRWIHKYTQIGLVGDVQVVCQHKVYVIEFQIYSTAGDNTNVWVVISRSWNRYVDELRYRESENLLLCKKNRKSFPKAKGQLHISIHQIWEDPAANEFSHGYKWKTQVSNFVSKLVRHDLSRERFSDGAIHWKIMCPKLIIKFQKDMEEAVSLTEIGSTLSGKVATKQVSSIV